MASEISAGNRKCRANHPLEFKRRLAQAACVPGVSVSKIALTHGINANMLFKWRRHYRAGLFGAVPAESMALLPVRVIDASADERPSPSHEAAAPIRVPVPTHSVIVIQLAHAQVRIEGAAEPATLRAVLEGLRS